MDKAGPHLLRHPRNSFIPIETSNIYYPTVFPTDTLFPSSAGNSIQIIFARVVSSPFPSPFLLRHHSFLDGIESSRIEIRKTSLLLPLVVDCLVGNGMEINSTSSPKWSFHSNLSSRESIPLSILTKGNEAKVNIKFYYNFASVREQTSSPFL